MTSFDATAARDALQTILVEAERWCLEEPLAPDDPDASLLDANKSIHRAQEIHDLLVRASSSMLNVALLGEFSSGKSFLIGGLVDRLEHWPTVNDEGVPSDQYVGLLHSASEAASACPVKVVPVDGSRSELDTSNRGHLRVRFEGSPDWVDIGNTPPPVVVAAYTTNDPESILQGRADIHRDRAVKEAEILLADPSIPAILCDLPGSGSNPIHDAIAIEARGTADCFIYTVPATRVLSSSLDEELIADLYAHHAVTGKPVIWVMTGIDRANMVREQGGPPAWKAALRECNAKLRNTLMETLPSTEHLESFIGPDGFIAVSSAWEAMGKRMVANGNVQDGELLQSASRMEKLRKVLRDLISASAGQAHLDAVVRTALRLLEQRQREVDGILAGARRRFEDYARDREHFETKLSRLEEEIDRIPKRLKIDYDARINRLAAGFHGLNSYLHNQLDDLIRTADLTNQQEASRIEIRRGQLLQEWARNMGPTRIWEHEFRSYTDAVLELVKARLRDTVTVEDLGTSSLTADLHELVLPANSRYQSDGQSALQILASVVGITTPVATAIASSAGLIATPFLAVPAAVMLTAGIIYTTAARRRKSATALDAMREEWIQGLDVDAKQYADLAVATARVRSVMVSDRVVEILSERSSELSREIVRLDGWLAEPEATDKRKLIEHLQPYSTTGERLIHSLNNFRTEILQTRT